MLKTIEHLRNLERKRQKRSTGKEISHLYIDDFCQPVS